MGKRFDRELLRLQFITNKKSEEDILAEVNAFLEGGGRWVQLRMKEVDKDRVALAGIKVKLLCDEYGAVFILNDHPEIAREIGADGVHIGSGDIPPDQARKILGKHAVIGCTANTIEDIRRLAAYDIDYIGLGPYRFTSTKKNLSPVLGAEGYENILGVINREKIDIPVVAIGGIEVSDIEMLKRVGVGYFAVSGIISNSSDPKEETEKIIKTII